MSKIIDAKKNGYQITYTGEKAERFIRSNGEYQQLSYGDGTTTVSSHKAEETKTVTSYDDHGQPTTTTQGEEKETSVIKTDAMGLI